MSLFRCLNNHDIEIWSASHCSRFSNVVWMSLNQSYGLLKNTGFCCERRRKKDGEDGSVCVAGGPKHTKAFVKRDIIVDLPQCNTIWKEEDGGGEGERNQQKEKKLVFITFALCRVLNKWQSKKERKKEGLLWQEAAMRQLITHSLTPPPLPYSLHLSPSPSLVTGCFETEG